MKFCQKKLRKIQPDYATISCYGVKKKGYFRNSENEASFLLDAALARSMSSSFEKEAYSPNPQPLTNLKNHRNCGENVFVYSPGQDYPLCGWWREQQIKTQFYTT